MGVGCSDRGSLGSKKNTHPGGGRGVTPPTRGELPHPGGIALPTPGGLPHPGGNCPLFCTAMVLLAIIADSPGNGIKIVVLTKLFMGEAADLARPR